MKAKIIALLMAAVLGVTGIAATAQAAEGGKPGETVQGTCPNGHSWYVKKTEISYAENGALGHYKCTKITYQCHGCQAEDSDDIEVLEDHTLRMPALGARWDCIYCEYYEDIYCP